MPDGMVPIVQEFIADLSSMWVAKQKRDPMEKVPVLKEYSRTVEDQLDEPFVFAPLSRGVDGGEWGAASTTLKMDTAFMEPMCVSNDSVLMASS